MDIHKVIGRLPRPKKGFVLPYHKYTGPWNPLDKQLDKNDNPLPGQEPYNAVDNISLHHDICYRDNNSKVGKQNCDDEMLSDLKVLKAKDLREKIDRKLVQGVMSTKRRMGWGVEWTNDLADELHKPLRHKFQKRKVFATSVDSIWTADLIDMQTFAKVNKGYRYLLTVIDVFSKFGWIIPLKTKTGAVVTQAFRHLFKTSERVPTRLWTDKGREFYNKSMKELLEKHHIQLYSTENEEKSSVVERWNRTMKRNMWKYFTANNTHNYINVLSALVNKYNNSYHRSIKTTPTKALNPKNFVNVYKALYGNMKELDTEPRFKVGDRVRISKKKKTFEKGFTPNWTEELFTISQVKDTKPPTYEIVDLKGDKVHGTFYEQELQKSTQTVYRIEKVLKRKTVKNGQKQILVKWKGYNKDFNTWIPLSDLQDEYK